MKPQCTERGWYQDPSANWRFLGSNPGHITIAGMGAHTLGIEGNDGVIYWICDQCRGVSCNSWPGLYKRPADALAAAMWDDYYLGPDAPAKIKAHGHDGDPATFHAHIPVGTQTYALHTIDEILPEGQREAFKRAYECEGPVLPTYCGNDPVTRNQIAVMIWKAAKSMIENPPGAAPPPATGLIFSDVPADGIFSPYIEDLFNRGVIAGKSPCEKP